LREPRKGTPSRGGFGYTGNMRQSAAALELRRREVERDYPSKEWERGEGKKKSIRTLGRSGLVRVMEKRGVPWRLNQ